MDSGNKVAKDYFLVHIVAPGGLYRLGDDPVVRLAGGFEKENRSLGRTGLLSPFSLFLPFWPGKMRRKELSPGPCQ